MNAQQINGLLRHAMTILGGYGFAVSQEQLLQLLSALATVLGILWSIYEKRDRSVRLDGPRGFAVLPLLVLAWCQVGCSSTKFSDVVTPARVKAVVTWGAYAGAKSQLPKERGKLELAQSALKTLQAAGTYDAASVAAALQAGGITWLSTTEGTLAVTAAITFEDLFHEQTLKITESEYTKAVLEGALTGLSLALDEQPQSGTRALSAPAAPGVEKRAATPAETEERLRARAVWTR